MNDQQIEAIIVKVADRSVIIAPRLVFMDLPVAVNCIIRRVGIIDLPFDDIAFVTLRDRTGVLSLLRCCLCPG